MERLQKLIAQSGVCSRRKAEELILAGKVKVNGKVVSTLGTKADFSDRITVDGKAITRDEKVYYVLNKPKGCVSTVKDDKDRHTVMDYVPLNVRVFPVGRLDYDTSGVLLMTNDGEFANKMLHPRYHLPKTYEVNLQGTLTDEDIRKLRKGFTWKGEKFAPAKVFVKDKDPIRDRTFLNLTIYEGKNHQVKKMMEALGHEVRRLNRLSFGFVTTEGLRPGEVRRLKPYDVRKLIAMAEDGDK
ncbi:pseudouridine synthase [Allobaculum mucilyticum]|uniref:pseudouridine synthase n=1 Tax=Allobaculum mucilyticum TaxID=2834459 RepID=UPI001E44B355|nr:pseudouridine synthase [Allobaculum mucilyticum]UNT96321.1 rRNA pseudouridine synthase [Allobaculum mucilyticum]